MKLFKYSNKNLTYVPVSIKNYVQAGAVCVISILILSFILFLTLNKYYQQNRMIRMNEEMKLIIIKEHNKFDRTSMMYYMKDINIKFPYIVYAQAVLESNDFTSNIFKENNNCFGMKVATVRQSTNKGSQYDHAVFDNWKDCIIDYALYQARYLSNIKTEEQYFTYLEQSYAEDPNYIQKLKSIIHNKKLREIFDLYETQTTN